MGYLVGVGGDMGDGGIVKKSMKFDVEVREGGGKTTITQVLSIYTKLILKQNNTVFKQTKKTCHTNKI